MKELQYANVSKYDLNLYFVLGTTDDITYPVFLTILLSYNSGNLFLGELVFLDGLKICNEKEKYNYPLLIYSH